MEVRARVFLDTSAVFSGIISADGGGRALLLLGEAGVVSLVLSRCVMKELEFILKNKAPEHMGTMALLLNEARVELVDDGDKRLVSHLGSLLNCRGDAEVLAAAIASKPDFFATHDKKHFLKNAGLKKEISFLLGTPGDCLAWLRARLE